MGGLGFSCDYPQEKFFRDCKVGEFELLIRKKKTLTFSFDEFQELSTKVLVIFNSTQSLSLLTANIDQQYYFSFNRKKLNFRFLINSLIYSVNA